MIAAVAVEDDVEGAAFAFHPDRDQWANAGFGSGSSASEWIAAGFSAIEAKAWRDEGDMSASTARSWSDAGFDAKQAAKATSQGFDDPDEVRVWEGFGFGVVRPSRWVGDEARRHGSAQEWRGSGPLALKPEAAGAWVNAGFVGNPFIAASLHHAGVDPDYGTKRLAEGMTYEDVIAEVAATGAAR